MADVDVVKTRTSAATKIDIKIRNRTFSLTRAQWQALINACMDGTREAYEAIGIVSDVENVTITIGLRTFVIPLGFWHGLVARIRAGEFNFSDEDG